MKTTAAFTVAVIAGVFVASAAFGAEAPAGPVVLTVAGQH